MIFFIDLAVYMKTKTFFFKICILYALTQIGYFNTGFVKIYNQILIHFYKANAEKSTIFSKIF